MAPAPGEASKGPQILGGHQWLDDLDDLDDLDTDELRAHQVRPTDVSSHLSPGAPNVQQPQNLQGLHLWVVSQHVSNLRVGQC